MQVKVIIGTVSFMLAMMVFGYAALREQARLERFTDARSARQIQSGAHLYEANCTTCHGENGKAEECFDPSSGEPIGCVGLPLNYAPLLCGDKSQRMEALNWSGTKESFINATLASGRYGTVMPTWLDQFGGPLRSDQVVDLTQFVLNWETEELCSAPIVTYDWPESYADFSVEFAEGDPAHGEELFLSYGCTGCHGNLEDETSAAVGPWLGNIAEVGGTRVEGLTADEYVYNSILNPSAYIVPECPSGPCTGPPSAMPDNFPLRMGENPQDLQDVMSYLFNN